MLTNALGPYYDGQGKNIMRMSIAAGSHGMFGEKLMAG